MLKSDVPLYERGGAETPVITATAKDLLQGGS